MSTPTIGGYDAAWPPQDPPPDDRVVMGYLGGDTPHPWSLADWLSQPARYRVGIWTRSDPQSHAQALGISPAALGTQEGRLAASIWKALGATPGSLIVVDLEMAVCPQFVTAMDAEVVAAGFKLAEYGSKSTLFQNPKASGGYFPADLTGMPHLYPGTLLTQYKFENNWDDDTVAASVVLWDTRPADPPPVPPGSARRNDMHLDLKPGQQYAFTPPAAVLGGTCHMRIVSDFGDLKVRIAVYSWNARGWSVHDEILVKSTDPGYSMDLPVDINKVSVLLDGDSAGIGGLDVFV